MVTETSTAEELKGSEKKTDRDGEKSRNDDEAEERREKKIRTMIQR